MFRAVILMLSLALSAGGALAAKKPAPAAGPARPPVGAPVRRVMKVPGAVCCDPYVGAVSLEADSGRVFFSERADHPGQPASMTKIMTALLVADELAAGRLREGDRLEASALAAGQEPSVAGLRKGQSMTVADLMASLMVKSANDAAVVLAEGVARLHRGPDAGEAAGDGLVADFVAMMNARAAALGMKDTRFSSPNGLPPRRGEKRRPDVSTAADIALLAREAVKRPEIMKYASMPRCTVTGGDGRPVSFESHNPFLRGDRNVKRLEGCDGLKTGYTDAAGSSIALTAVRNGRRAIVVVLGSSSRKLREDAASHLMADALGALSW